METLLAIPSKNPGGLQAAPDAHFGHCDVYTLVRVADNTIVSVELLPLIEHEHGGCTSMVDYLAGKGVQVLLAGGMGVHPLNAFRQKNIQVYHAANFLNVQMAVEAFIEKKLQSFEEEHLCQGGCGNH